MFRRIVKPENIDTDELRKDLIEHYMSAFVVTGFGAAFIEASDVQTASDEELIEIAQNANFRLDDYTF